MQKSQIRTPKSQIVKGRSPCRPVKYYSIDRIPIQLNQLNQLNQPNKLNKLDELLLFSNFITFH